MVINILMTISWCLFSFGKSRVWLRRQGLYIKEERRDTVTATGVKEGAEEHRKIPDPKVYLITKGILT